ncbi:MAG: GIY-YIG nuclease family protein, partial [Patescibacteria group bacterium]
VLYSQEQNKFYIGSTGDLRRRMYEHNNKKSLSDKTIKNLKLVYYECCISKSDSTKREKQLKTGFGRAYLRNRLADSIRPRSSTDRTAHS